MLWRIRDSPFSIQHSYSFIYEVYESHEEAVTDVAGVPNIDGMLYLPASS